MSERRRFCVRWDQPALPFVREAARQDPNPKVRERANEILGGPVAERVVFV